MFTVAVIVPSQQMARLDRRLAQLPDQLKRVGRRTLEQQGALALRHLIRTHLSAPHPTRTAVSRRTGALIRSYRYRVRQRDQALELAFIQLRSVRGRLGARPAVYGPVLERGAIIRAKHGGNLTIPLHPRAEARRARTVVGLFPITSRRGNHLLVMRRGAGIEPWYLLRKSVRIPGRHMVRSTVRWARPRAVTALRGAYRRTLMVRRG